MTQTLLEIRDIHKRFPGVYALRGVSLDVRAGEVHALVGENGAGKSTLMHLLAGVHQPEAPGIFLNGQEVRIPDQQAAQRLGIAIVYQERSLFPLLSVAENIFAGRQPSGRYWCIDKKTLYAQATKILAELGVDVDPGVMVGALSPATQQMVEIAKALSLQPRILILDEPTAALTEAETKNLFRVIAALRAQGIAIIYISHRLEEIFQIADRVTVLRDGSYQGTLSIAETNPDDLVRRMVGRDLRAAEFRPPVAPDAELLFSVKGLSCPAGSLAKPVLRDVGLHVRRGEVLVLAGLAGAGRTEVALSIFGARDRGAGEIKVGNVVVNPDSPRAAIAAGIGYLSEDRKDLGLFMEMSVAENVAAVGLGRFGGFWLDDKRRDAVAGDYQRRLNIRCRDVGQVVRGLSGGNQQKVALAKWLLIAPKVLIVDEPTRGVDVGAKGEMHAMLFELAEQGTAVIVISSDLPEVLALGDRIAVMREGRVVTTIERSHASEEVIMTWAARDRGAPS